MSVDEKMDIAQDVYNLGWNSHLPAPSFWRTWASWLNVNAHLAVRISKYKIENPETRQKVDDLVNQLKNDDPGGSWQNILTKHKQFRDCWKGLEQHAERLNPDTSYNDRQLYLQGLGIEDPSFDDTKACKDYQRLGGDDRLAAFGVRYEAMDIHTD